MVECPDQLWKGSTPRRVSRASPIPVSVERERGGGGGRDMGWNVTWEGSKYAYTSTLYGTTHDLPVKYKVIVQ